MRTEVLDDGFEVNILEDYSVLIKAIQVPIFTDEVQEDENIPELWKFVVEILDANEEKSIELPSYKTHETFEDSIQDAYGVIDLLGFEFKNADEPVKVEVFRWSYEDQELYVDYVLFDGFDFFPYEGGDEEDEDSLTEYVGDEKDT